MSLIKILANGIEVDFVKESLTIRKENNSLISDFKIAHSSIPFLLIENKKLVEALGNRELSSINKIKTIEVVVVESGFYYTGELQVLSYLKGFRKANLKYASDLLKIMNKKISEFMPIVSVIPGETNPTQYTEESDAIISGDTNWPAYYADQITKGFPEVKFNFPLMTWKNKFGEKLEIDDPWFDYKNKVNFTLNEVLVLNTSVYTSPTVIEVHNSNVIMPQVYLLSPLFYILQSIGFKSFGNFINDAFIKKILFFSSKNNLCEVNLAIENTEVVFLNDWNYVNGNSGYKRTVKTFAIDSSGSYTIDFNFVIPIISPRLVPFTVLKVLRFYGPGIVDYEIVFQRDNSIQHTIIGDFEMQFEAGDTIVFEYWCANEVFPISYSLKYRRSDGDKDFYQFHPTISLGRYLPDWTVATYLNELKKLFNLQFTIDDFTKSFYVDYNEEEILISVNEKISKSLYIDSYEANAIDSFLLKYENDEDNALWITKESVVDYNDQTSDFSQLLQSKFKFVPSNTSTSDLSDALLEKEGVGLLIYDEVKFPNTSTQFLENNLLMTGSKGIYNKFWKVFLKFRLNASTLEISGIFSEKEVRDIISKSRIWLDNQEYIIAFIEYKETNQFNYEIKFKVESINF
jgi:hypothetical protein